MSEICQYLDTYPLAAHYTACRRYLREHMDWSDISRRIGQESVIALDVSDALSCFSHLVLDEHYKLLCYLAREYHGIWGRVAAVRDSVPRDPVIREEDAWLSTLFCGQHFELPEAAAPPMEAIYHDGSPEGYLEAVLCESFLAALPYQQYEQDNWHIVETAPPADLDERWDVRLRLPDWRPRTVGNTLLLCRRVVENGLGSSSGRDRIYLTQYSFQPSLAMYHHVRPRDRHSVYRGQIDDDKRYGERRRCCVAASSAILLAEESAYRAKVF